MRLKGWGDSAEARRVIRDSIERFAANPAEHNF
jgi:hypothetical protein